MCLEERLSKSYILSDVLKNMIFYFSAGTATGVENFPSPIGKLKLQWRYFCYTFKFFLHVAKYVFKFTPFVIFSIIGTSLNGDATGIGNIYDDFILNRAITSKLFLPGSNGHYWSSVTSRGNLFVTNISNDWVIKCHGEQWDFHSLFPFFLS